MSLVYRRVAVLLLLAALVLTSCNLPARGAPTPAGAAAIYTAAAQTLQAQITRIGQPTAMPPGATTPGATGLPPITTTPGTNPTTPIPSATDQATPGASTCDAAQFVRDVTVPDDSNLQPGASFQKTWELKNTGTCAWTTGYSIVVDGQNPLGAPASTPLTADVPPGGSAQLSVSLKAPAEAGVYRTNFKLANASRQLFGIGDTSDPFWVQIRVTASAAGLNYDFIANSLSTSWSSGVPGGEMPPLAFGGGSEDANGTAKIIEGLEMENNGIAGKVLLTFPKRVDNGVVSGIFSAYTVQPGDHFRARLGFLKNPGTAACGAGNVTFELNYKFEENLYPLQSWTKSCDGHLLRVDVDLSALQGKSVQFILVVKANGSSQDDWAIWNSALISR